VKSLCGLHLGSVQGTHRANIERSFFPTSDHGNSHDALSKYQDA
jgi:hypothetical protein